MLVHRLVARAFLQNENKYAEINHKDEDTLTCVVKRNGCLSLSVWNQYYQVWDDVWVRKPEELERVNSQSTDWDKVRINAAIVNMQTLMAQSWQMEADEVAKVAVKYADALIKELQK